MILKVVFRGDNGQVEYKIAPESGNNHLVYMVGNFQLLPNGDGNDLITGPAGDWIVTSGGLNAPNLGDWWGSIKNL
jgi:hypothetical protein